MSTSKIQKDELLDHLLTAASREQLGKALEQLLTPVEYDEIATRWQILQMLRAGIAQRTIAQTLGVGIATVSRGARALKTPTE